VVVEVVAAEAVLVQMTLVAELNALVVLVLLVVLAEQDLYFFIINS
jgi:hypothetical protein